jgi:two-component sensor histidine kinase
VAVILALAFNALLLFLFRPKEKAYLFFALFGLSIVFRVFLTGEYLIMNVFPAMSFDTLIRLEYATVAFPLPLAAFSFSTLFPDESKPRLLFYVSLPFLARLLFDLSMVPLTLLARSIWVFYPLAIVAIIVIFVGVLLPALRHKRQGAMTILLGTLVLILSFANDSLFSAFLINTGNFLGFCLIAFMIVQSGVLTKRFSIAFDRGEALQAELSLANERLNAENERYKEAQGELQVALAEKDLLLREVHHRVKNSLQIVSSILGLQANRSGDASEINVFMMARSRIRAISLVHEKLYGIKSAEYLDLGSYARDLVDQLSWSFGGGQGGARITVKAEHIEADVDTCVDFGLMLTELVGNACKHGSAGRAGVGIVVHLERMAGGLVLRVEDDGPGFKEGFSLDASNSLGYRVVSGLVKKHDGEIVILPGPGARIELRLAIREHEPAAKGPSAARPEASAGGEEPGAGVGSFTNNGSEAVAR